MDMKYSIGVHFGSLTGRAVLVEVSTGNEIATSTLNYPHAIMREYLPDNKTKLSDGCYALQHPQDYLDVLSSTIPAVLSEGEIDPSDVIGVGIDFMASTVLPVTADGTPLCFIDKYKTEPHAYVKNYKHSVSQKYADKINKVASRYEDDLLSRFGGKISSDSMITRAMQIADEAPEVYDAMDKFIEAADWVVWKLTGKETRNSCSAEYKALWNTKNGFPKKEFFKALNPKLENFVDEKINCEINKTGEKAGEITEYSSKLTSLDVGTIVAIGNIHAHVALPAVGITEPGKMLMNIGTSTCDVVLSEENKFIPGISGVAENSSIPGYFEYEAGQSCVGDQFDWFVKTSVPESYYREANALDMTIHQLLRTKACKQKPGENGLIALDWWNGNKSVLANADLTGVIIGYNLLSRPEDVYRTLIESTAYGTRMIVETFEKGGLSIKELYAAGNIAEKDAFMMQIYADVTNRDVKISASPHTPALGSAMFATVAAGKVNGGYDNIIDCAEAMSQVKVHYYKPIPENVEIYDKLYAEYKNLHSYFGSGENNVMKRLNNIKRNVKAL